MLWLRLHSLIFLCTPLVCHCNSSSANATSVTDKGSETKVSNVTGSTKGAVTNASVTSNSSKSDNVNGSVADSPKATVTNDNTTSASTGVVSKGAEENTSEAKNQTAQKDQTAQNVSGSEKATPSQNVTTPAQNITAQNITAQNITTTTTTRARWVRPTTPTTTPSPPGDPSQLWITKDDPCFVECKEHLEKVFGAGPLPPHDSATFAIKMMARCRRLMDWLKCTRDKPAQCPPGNEIAQSVEFYAGMCMCPCKDAFVKGLRKTQENPEANMCVNFQDFAGCASCSTQREECDYALIDTKTEVAGRLLQAASDCSTASCTNYLWQWQPVSELERSAADGDEAGRATRTSGVMSSISLYSLFVFWAFCANRAN